MRSRRGGSTPSPIRRGPPGGEPAGLRDDAPQGWVVGGDEPGSAGVVGSPGRSRRGGSRRPFAAAVAREVNPPGFATTPRQQAGWSAAMSPVQRAWW
ncbi:MAG: hypothetical protein R3A10_19200 [Caldilineaceae bacterium]